MMPKAPEGFLQGLSYVRWRLRGRVRIHGFGKGLLPAVSSAERDNAILYELLPAVMLKSGSAIMISSFAGRFSAKLLAISRTDETWGSDA
ncbi:hypothetical protein [Succinimonas sp.]|uniref:hypothetical protein n=1 Tax=Succinimonas sp. TaxID=1936151 RepID=UPI00386DEBC7